MQLRRLGLFILCVSAASAADCDRSCLKNTMTAYLNALVAHDPSRAFIASNARFTEDSKDLTVGDGLWKTATKLGDYRQDYIDVKEQVVASHVTVEESGKRALYTVRLKVAGGKITEIETVVTHGSDRMSGGETLASRPGMDIEPPPAQKNKREELIRIANYYPRGLTVGGFDKVDAPFADDAFRIENGFVMAGEGCGRGTPSGRPARAANAAGGSAVVSATSPQDVAGCLHMKTQRIITHPDLTKSLVAVDEEQGIVLLWMNFGDTGTYGEGNALIALEAFKVYGGQVHAVQAFLKILPKDTARGWGKTLRGSE